MSFYVNSHISLCDYSVMTLGMLGFYIKVIPQKKKMLMNFFETLPECSLPNIVSKKNNKNDRSPFSLMRCDESIFPHLYLYLC